MGWTRELALFAGSGGGILGGKLLGWRPVCAVEINPFCREVLLRRQLDGCLPRFPIWDDVRTFDGQPWRGFVDVISGGFPCQDISSAGKGAGLNGEHSGLWSEFARIIREVQPRYAFVENSPMLTTRGLGRVLGDLAEMGFDARWCVLGADDVGAPHIRKRIWILAHANCRGEYVVPIDAEVASAPALVSGSSSNRCAPSERGSNAIDDQTRRSQTWWTTEPGLVRVVHGLANRVDRISALGNGQVPAVARLAWELLA